MSDYITKFLSTVVAWFVVGIIFWLYCMWSDRKSVTRERLMKDISTLIKGVLSIRFLLLGLTSLLPLLLIVTLKHATDNANSIKAIILLAFSWSLYELWKRYCPEWQNKAVIALFISLLFMATSN